MGGTRLFVCSLVHLNKILGKPLLSGGTRAGSGHREKKTQSARDPIPVGRQATTVSVHSGMCHTVEPPRERRGPGDYRACDWGNEV